MKKKEKREMAMKVVMDEEESGGVLGLVGVVRVRVRVWEEERKDS